MIKPIAFFLALLFASPAFSQPANTELNKCLADNTTGRDRKDLARWFFASMAVHPEMRDLANPTPGITERTSQTMGTLVTRLFTEKCAKEARAAVRRDGPGAIAKAFEALGQLGFIEIMSNADVMTAASTFERYVDQAKMKSTLHEGP